MLAQRHERVFTRLWDALRAEENDKLSILAETPFSELTIHESNVGRSVSNDVRVSQLNGPTKKVTPAEFRKRITAYRNDGWRLLTTEWHHETFDAPDDRKPARSRVSFVLHLQNETKKTKAIVRGKLRISWAKDYTGNQLPSPGQVEVEEGEILLRGGFPAYRKVAEIDARKLERGMLRMHPLILYDLNGDGLSEVILGGVNLVHWNLGNGQFKRADLVKHWRGEIGESGLIADFTGDAVVDFLCVTARDRVPVLFKGQPGGKFETPGQLIEAAKVQNASVMTAGDINRDGDLDVWLTQYRRAYTGGQMPTPFYDANDGYPSYLLVNDGQGGFVDETESRGLGEKRYRRTYSASFADLNDDNALDLLVVSDFSGTDIYENDGSGHFKDVRDSWVDQWHNFGMAHSFGDYDLDGKLDFYVIGMSSTTMRRLNYMDLNRPGFPQHESMRTIMGYGNRMYLRSGMKFISAPQIFNTARTGWSWGCSSLDFDNDGDLDLYVANGFISGESSEDYCTTFWRHDIYTGTSNPDAVVASVLNFSQAPIVNHSISWNGFEHNALLMNESGDRFESIGYLMGVALNQDCRAVASDDLDGDGRMDLLVMEERFGVASKKGQILHVLGNQLQSKNNWIGIRLKDGGPGKSPIGATVQVKVSNQTLVDQIVTGDSFFTQHAPNVHFGLGNQNEVESITVRWISGDVRVLASPKINQYHQIE